jgi:hypothetical protein
MEHPAGEKRIGRDGQGPDHKKTGFSGDTKHERSSHPKHENCRYDGLTLQGLRPAAVAPQLR